MPPEATTRSPGPAFGLVDDEVFHLTDTMTVRVKDHEPSDVVGGRSQSDLTLFEGQQAEGERGHGASLGCGGFMLPCSCDHPRPATLQFRDDARAVARTRGDWPTMGS
jgi:hypothetical protein